MIRPIAQQIKNLHELPNQSSFKTTGSQISESEKYSIAMIDTKLKENINIKDRRRKSVNIDNRKITVAIDNDAERPSIDSYNQVRRDYSSIRKRLSVEKSTLILVVIVVFFVITHSNRLALKVYMTMFPHLNTTESFKRCLHIGR